jgi:hypothetical protein
MSLAKCYEKLERYQKSIEELGKVYSFFVIEIRPSCRIMTGEDSFEFACISVQR